jgi:hypothetical protein
MTIGLGFSRLGLGLGAVPALPPKPRASWPSATNTGVPSGTTFTPSGSIESTTANQVISGLDITGYINVTSDGVVIENCRVNCGNAYFAVDALYATNTTVRDCELKSGGDFASGGIRFGDGGTALRNNIYGFETGIFPGNNTRIQDNYIHDLDNTSKADPHIDGIGIHNGSNIEVRHNTIVSWNTSCVLIKSDFTNIDNVVVDNNLLIRTPGKDMGYTIYSDSAHGGPYGITNVSYTDNVIERGLWGYANFDGNSPTYTGNTDYITGKPIGFY